MSKELFCDFCNDKIEGKKYLELSNGKVVCCQRHQCLRKALGAKRFEGICVFCEDKIDESDEMMVLPDGGFVHDYYKCLEGTLVRFQKAVEKSC